MKKPRAKKTTSEVKWVIKMMNKHGSLTYGEKLAEKLAAEAKEILTKKLTFLSRQPARDQLIAGIDFILERKH